MLAPLDMAKHCASACAIQCEERVMEMAKPGSVARLTVRAFILIGSLACQPVAWAGDDRGTPDQQAACTPDAFRLCFNAIPDPDRVEACLRQRKSDLSTSCRAVFEHGRATVSSAR
jgi:hypothetical protein